MSKEQQELVDEAYKYFIYNPDYKAEGVADLMGSQAGQLVKCPTQKDFINKIKTDEEFSEKWGLKIEERELSLEERKIYMSQYSNHRIYPEWDEKFLNEKGIPTKLITLTYTQTIESYE
jgi:hypothetical protein